jgi:TP901 family phage tail tape measure protein
MAREVSVKITANTSGFNSGMDQAGSKAAQTAAKIKASFDSGLTGISKNSRSINTLSSGLGKVGLIAAVGFGAAIKSAADFDQAMSNVAATGADARANMSALRDAAIKAGADTKFSATEAAGGVEALAKAGVSAKDTLGGGLTGALNLAAAGNLDVGSSAEVAASAMNQFGLAGKDIPHIADLLAQGAGVAQGEVSDMAAALNQSGLVANQFGLSIDETAQSLSLFAKNGLIGSDAGTSFKTMLTSLYAPTSTGAKALKRPRCFGLRRAGQLKPIGVLADDLKGKLDGLTAEDRNAKLRAIFGSDAIRAGTILLKDGSAGLSDMAARVRQVRLRCGRGAHEDGQPQGRPRAVEGFVRDGSDRPR